MANLLKIVNRFAVLKQLPIFSKLKWFELQKIAYKCTFAEYKKGEIICREGAPPDAFYCVVSGRVQAYIVRGNTEKKNVEFIHRGMYFGIISLLTGENHSMTFEALNDSVILKIDKADFSTILDLVPRLGIEFSHSLSRRLRSRDSSKSIFESSIISIYSPVRASGSSTFAINLAFNLEKETKKKVILVHITSLIEQMVVQKASGEASPTWKKNGIDLKSIAGDHQKITQSISHGELKIDVLNVTFDPRDYWLINQISHFVSLLANDYHFVVVDLPSDMDEVVLKTLTQSDMVYLIAVDRQEDLKMTRQVLDKLKDAHKEKFQKEKIQVIISGVQEKSQMTYEDLGKAIDYNIFRVLPYITRQQLSVAVVSDDITAIMPELNSEYSKSVRRIARELGGVLVALVLGGGAALGVSHIGVLRVLEKENIPIDMIVGSSIGALIGGLWAVGKDANGIEAVAREFEQKKAGLKLIDAFPSKSGFSGRNLTKWLRRHFGDRTFYSCKIPLIVIAYDLIRREELDIAEGSLVDAVRQSVAIPGIISPIVTKDRLIIDGGVINPLPTNVASGLGIKKIIAVNVLQSPQDVVKGQEMFEKQLDEEAKIPFTKSPVKYCGVRVFRVLTKLFYPNIADIIVRGLQAVEYVIAEQSAQQADVLIRPNLVGINWFELYQVDRLVASGEEAAYRHLAEIKKLVSD